jgi:hypothetical protein
LPPNPFPGLDVQSGGQGHGNIDEEPGRSTLGTNYLHFHLVLSLHNFALDRHIGDELLHPTTVVNFRERSLDHALSAVGFQAVRAALMEAAAEGRELMGPAPKCANNHEGRFPSEPFDVAVEQRRAVCPGKQHNTQGSRLVENATGRVS